MKKNYENKKFKECEETFTLYKKGAKRQEILNHYYNACYDTLDNVYKTHYSSEKYRIFQKYLKMCYDLGGRASTYGVHSANGFFITLEFLFYYRGIKYYAYITPRYNYLIEIND